MKEQHNRFKDAPWYPGEKKTHILIGGAGGIGSWTALLVARAGFSVIIFDDDVIEKHNYGGQFFNDNQLGMAKVEATRENLAAFCTSIPLIFNEKVTPDSMSHNICIAAFDNMQARRDMFKSWKDNFSIKAINPADYNPDSLFIDPRLEAEQMWIHCVPGDDENKIIEYENNYLGDPEHAVDDAVSCTMKQTSHGAAMIAAHIVGFLTNHMTNIIDRDGIRALPFVWEYNIPMNLVTEIN